MTAQVEIVLNMLRPVVASLTVSEKSELLAAITDLLEAPSSNPSNSGQSQANTVSGVTFGQGNSAFNFSPVQSQKGNVNISPNFAQTSAQNTEVKDVIEALVNLKQSILQNEEISPLVKDGAKVQIEQLEKELQKPEPDKGLIEHTIVTLKKGLEGVLTLAAPTMKVASLIAKVWGIPVS